MDSPGSLLEALGSLLGPLGVVLGRSWGLLGRSWAILGRSWGILRRSWVALGGSWFALGGSWLDHEPSWRAKRARRAAGQEAWKTRGAKSYPPLSDSTTFDPPSTLDTRGLREEKNGTQDHREEGRVRTTGKREE